MVYIDQRVCKSKLGCTGEKGLDPREPYRLVLGVCISF